MLTYSRRLISLFFISLLAAHAAVAGEAAANTASTTKAATSAVMPMPSMAPMLKRVMPAVVNISVEGTMPVMERGKKGDDESSYEAQPRKRKFHGFGSGVIVDAKQGYIITNAHVIKSAKTIAVTVNDGRRFTAKLIGADPASDIAVLQIKAKGLHGIPLGDVTKLEVGDYTVAIGNPFNLSKVGATNQTATFGIISALQRTNLHLEGVENFIQTDAAINPGNSGGALVNLAGELIGINAALIGPYGGNVGIGLAIPVDIAHNIMDQLVKYGSVHRGLMGVYVQQLTPELAAAFGMQNAKGALVTQVNLGSPAEKAGIRGGDLLQDINGQSVETAAQVKNIIKLLRVGDKVKISLLRDGKAKTINTVIADVGKHVQQQKEGDPFLYGLALKNLEQHSPIRGVVRGVQILNVSEGTPGWQAGLRPGDVIMAANKQPVINHEQLKAIAVSSGEQLLLHVARGAGAIFLVVKSI